MPQKYGQNDGQADAIESARTCTFEHIIDANIDDAKHKDKAQHDVDIFIQIVSEIIVAEQLAISKQDIDKANAMKKSEKRDVEEDEPVGVILFEQVDALQKKEKIDGAIQP